MKNISTDEFGRVRERGIHDSTLTSLRMEGDKSCEVGLQDAEGRILTIHCLELSRICFKDLMNGMIVSTIFAWELGDKRAVSLSAMEAWSILLHDFAQNEDRERFIAETRAREPSHFLVLFQSSYGGSIALICRAIATVVPGG